MQLRTILTPNGLLRYFEIMVLIVLLNSCAIYTAQVIPPVAIEKPLDVQVDAGASLAYFTLSPGINLSAAIGVTDHLYGQAYASYMVMEAFHYEANLGYFNKLKNGKRLDIQSGYFRGKLHVEPLFYFNNIVTYGQYGDYCGPYLKMQYSTIASDNPIQVGISLKTALFYPNVKWSTPEGYMDLEISPEIPINGIYTDKGLLLEPGVFIRYNEKRSSFFIMASFSYLHALSNNKEKLPTNGLGNLNFGYSYAIDLAKGKKK